VLKQRSWQVVLAGVAVTSMLAGVTVAQQGEEADASSAPQTQSSNPASNQPQQGSAEDVMKNLIEQIKQNPLIEPSGTQPAGQSPATLPQGQQPARTGVDPNVIGVAPGSPAPKLRREGEFVIARKGRLVRSSDGLHTLFVFEADSEKSPEAPMALLPCQMLQSMEDLVGQRGDQLKFVLSGQILVYRGANYLLPTMMTLAEDRGNLQ
jgi:hypothetical protein